MVDDDQAYLEIPTGKFGGSSPDQLTTLQIPLPRNTNPTTIALRHETDPQSIASSSTETLHWHDSLDDILCVATANLTATGVNKVNVDSGGSYGQANSSQLSLNWSAPDEAGAEPTATANLNGIGQITSITITDAGSGYTKPATLTITGTVFGFKQGSFTPVLGSLSVIGTSVASVTIDEGGSGYVTANATITDSDEGGTDAVLGTPAITNAAITSIAVTTAGDGYTKVPIISLSPPTGIEEDIIVNKGVGIATLCILLFDTTGTIATGDVEIWGTNTKDTVNDIEDTLLQVLHGGIASTEFMYPVTPIWLPNNLFLTIKNNNGSTAVIVDRVISLTLENWP